MSGEGLASLPHLRLFVQSLPLAVPQQDVEHRNLLQGQAVQAWSLRT